MTDLRRFIWLLTLASFLITAGGCTTNRWVSVNEEMEREGSGLHKEAGQAITAYQLNDSIEVDFKGQVKFSAQDTLFFGPRNMGHGISAPGKICLVPSFP